MKWLYSAVALFSVQVALAAPKLKKRTSTSEACSVGYCTLNGGTTGGGSATAVTVSTLDDLISAVDGDDSKVVIIDGTITGSEAVDVGSNTSILGASGATLSGVGLRVKDVSNVIIRNVKIEKVLADAGDAIGVQAASQVWIDHNDLSSDQDHDKDYYDGLLDITHGCYGVTVSNNYLHDHWKASLVGHSDNNGDEDAALRVTYYGNFFENLNSRGPSFRFGEGHIFNNYYSGMNDGINTRDGAELLVENNVFVDSDKALYSTDEGYAVASGNDFGDSENTAETGSITASDLSYDYDLVDTDSVASSVQSEAGQTLSF